VPASNRTAGRPRPADECGMPSRFESNGLICERHYSGVPDITPAQLWLAIDGLVRRLLRLMLSGLMK
jgi:hypothetical protein